MASPRADGRSPFAATARTIPAQVMGETPTVAIVGAGLMGAWHARYARSCGASICGVVDRDHAAAGQLASQFAAGRAFAELARLLELFRPDVIHVCTPLDSHFEIAAAALESGVHVLAEKPLTADAAAAGHLLSMAEQKSLLLAPVHQFLFQRGFLRTQAAVPQLGRILHIDAIFCSAGGERNTAGDLDEIAAEILPHPLALVERLVPGVLKGIDWSCRRPMEGEWRISGDGRGISISTLISLHGRPTESTLRIVTDGGVIELDLFHGYATIDAAPVSKASKITRPFRKSVNHFRGAAGNLARRLVTREFAYPGLRTLISEFYAALRNRSPSPISPGEIMAVARARDHLLQSGAFTQRRSAP